MNHKEFIATMIVYIVTLIIALLLSNITNIISNYHYAKLKRLLKEKGIILKTLLISIKSEVIQLPEAANVEVKMRKNYKYNCFYGSNTVGISTQWLYDYVNEDFTSVRSFEELFFSICHELGHKHYHDNKLTFNITPSQILKARMKEIRADLYAKKISGYDNVEASRVISLKISRAKLNMKQSFYSAHPSWSIRAYCIANFSNYEENEEAIRTLCKHNLYISQTKLNNIYLSR